MSANLLMALLALAVVVTAWAWISGFRGLTTVRLMQLVVVGQFALMAVSLWNWNSDRKLGRECQRLTQRQPAMPQTVFYDEVVFLAKDSLDGVVDSISKFFLALVFDGREEFEQRRCAFLNLVSIDACQQEVARRYYLRISFSNAQFFVDRPYDQWSNV